MSAAAPLPLAAAEEVCVASSKIAPAAADVSFGRLRDILVAEQAVTGALVPCRQAPSKRRGGQGTRPLVAAMVEMLRR